MGLFKKNDNNETLILEIQGLRNYIAILNRNIKKINKKLGLGITQITEDSYMRFTPDPKDTERWNKYYIKAEAKAEKQFESYIQPILKNNPDISLENMLDFACGFGRIANIFKHHANKITCCDINKRAIDFCKERFVESGKTQSHKCIFEYCISDDSLTLPFSDKEFSFIISWDAMVHFKYKWVDYYLGEIYRILKNGGYALIHHSNYGNVEPEKDKSENYLDNPHSRANMKKEDVTRLAERYGFKVVEQITFDWHEVQGLDSISLLKK